jgi:predicted transposase/invertase (TIGR01784 family)
MDSLEVLENKGYTSIAEADYEEGFLDGEAKGKAEGFLDGINDAKREMAKAMLLKGYPLEDVSLISGLSEEEIKEL